MKNHRPKGRGPRRRIALLSAMAALLVMAIAPAAMAQEGFEVTIPIDTVVTAAPTSITPFNPPVNVPEEEQGQECSVIALAENQESVHPNNDLIVTSGSSEVVIPDVEASPDTTIEGLGTLTLGPTILVSLRMGGDGVFSAGFDIIIDCTPLTPDPGRIIVVKQVTEGSDTTQAFDFAASYDSNGFSLADGEQNDSGDLDPGTYSVSETLPDGWNLQSATCDDQSPANAVELSAGETVTCTFVNDEIPDEVLASVQVTVDSTCDVVDDAGEGVIDITFSVADGATVVVRDSDGDVVGTLSSDGTITVPENASYTWEATANEGFEFPPGFEPSGSIVIETCSNPETLPFTGPPSPGLLALATALLGGGALVLFSTRHREE